MQMLAGGPVDKNDIGEVRTMEKETKEVVLSHIKDGTYVSNMLFDVQELMAKAGMELYAKPCCDRIEAAGLVDKVHVLRIQPSHGNYRWMPMAWRPAAGYWRRTCSLNI